MEITFTYPYLYTSTITKTFRKMKEVIDMLLQEVRNINGVLDLLYPEKDDFYQIGKKLTEIDNILSQIEE